MRALVLAAIAALVGGFAWGQPTQDTVTLPQFMEDLDYLQFLNAAQLTSEQLQTLLDLQLAWQAELVPTADVAAALDEVRKRVLAGATADQAINALGPRQQAVQAAQQRLQESQGTLTTQLAESLTDEQRAALVWATSPAHYLQNVVDALTGARAVPDEMWTQMRTGLTQGIGTLIMQADPGAGVTPEGIGALLDGARGMSNEEFAAAAPGLARAWAAKLMPNLLRQLEDPVAQQERVKGACQRLLTFERGPELVEARLDAQTQK